jgi:NitT/TauT family transport system substrate-binding protein
VFRCYHRTMQSTMSTFFGSAAVSILLFLGANSSCTSKPGHKFHIAVGPWVGFGPLYLAQDKGFFREAGIDVKLTVLTGLAERQSALKSGSIDGLAAPIDSFVLAAGNGVEALVVMAIDESSGGDGIVSRSGIKMPKELKGKRVAVQRGLPGDFFLRTLLQRNGMSMSDLDIVDMETAQAGAAFLAKQVDAAVVWEPWLTKAADSGGRILASTRDFPNLIVDCLGIRKAKIDTDRQGVQALVNSILRAIRYAKSHPAESARLMAPYFQVDAGKFEAITGGLRFCDLTRNREYFGVGSAATPPIHEVSRIASSIWSEAKVMARPVDPVSLVSFDFVKSAVE